MPTLTLKSPHSQFFQSKPNIFFPFPQSSSFLLAFRPLTTTTTIFHSVSARNRHTATQPWLAQLPEESTTANTTAAEEAPPEEGPIEIPSSTPSIFATSENPTPLQTATSVLLTGAISVFLFRSLRRRAKRAKELKFRSSGAKKSLKEEALENLKVMAPTPIDGKSPPSPVQALVGGLTAGVIALILYKFSTTIEAALNRQTLSDNFSVGHLVKPLKYYPSNIPHCIG